MSADAETLAAWLGIGGIWGLDYTALGRLHDRWPEPGRALVALRGAGEDLAGIVRPSHRDRVAASAGTVDIARTSASLAATGARAEATREARAFGRLERELGWPPALAVLGDVGPGESGVSVAVVGMRKCSASGHRFAFELGRGLADRGVSVVSGLAYGIDGAAHDGALSIGGRHIGVLAGGFACIYPKAHRPLARRIVDSGGALLAHVPPHVGAEGWRFPIRNRLIAGLADVVIVVEAARRGGALSTARHARDLDRSLLAVPGFPWSAQSVGTNALLADGVELCRDVDDVLTAISLCAPNAVLSARGAGPAAGGHEPGAVGADAQRVLECVEHVPISLDDLAERAGVPAAELLCRLDELEMSGRVSFVSPSTVQRVDKP